MKVALADNLEKTVPLRSAPRRVGWRLLRVGRLTYYTPDSVGGAPPAVGVVPGPVDFIDKSLGDDFTAVTIDTAPLTSRAP